MARGLQVLTLMPTNHCQSVSENIVDERSEVAQAGSKSFCLSLFDLASGSRDIDAVFLNEPE